MESGHFGRERLQSVRILPRADQAESKGTQSFGRMSVRVPSLSAVRVIHAANDRDACIQVAQNSRYAMVAFGFRRENPRPRTIQSNYLVYSIYISYTCRRTGSLSLPPRPPQRAAPEAEHKPLRINSAVPVARASSRVASSPSLSLSLSVTARFKPPPAHPPPPSPPPRRPQPTASDGELPTSGVITDAFQRSID